MSDYFHLLAILKIGTRYSLTRLPINRDLQESLSADWHDQHDRFWIKVQEVPFHVGYTPDDGEVFSLRDFQLPDWFQSATDVMSLEQTADEDLEKIAGVVGTLRERDEDILLFQNFSRSRVISPKRALVWMQEGYSRAEKPGLTLDEELSAVYYTVQGRLLFRSYRTVNSFLPLKSYYWTATEGQIRRVLAHDLFEPENVDAIAVKPTQWLARRFAILDSSDLLDKRSAQYIVSRAPSYGVDVTERNGKIVFPKDLQRAKRLLQFLCEEVFRGALTDQLYETNSKRPAE